METTALETIEIFHCDVLDSFGSKGLTEQYDSPFVGLVQLQCNSFDASLVFLGYLECIMGFSVLKLGIIVLLLLIYLEQFGF